MKRNKTRRNIFLVCFISCLMLPNVLLNAQNVTDYSSNDAIPLDSQVCYGKLPNGFTYYIRRNVDTENKTIIMLRVKAGHFQEDSSQLRIAHLLEHLAFRETKNFPEGVYRILERDGMVRGSDVTAYTEFESTTYYLKVPADSLKLFNTSLQFMRDVCQGILMTRESFETEGKAVLDETRTRTTLEADLRVKEILKATNYNLRAQVLHKHTMVMNQDFDYKSLVRFYIDWYRPNLQGLVIVGSIDVKQTEAVVKKMFSDLKNPKRLRIKGNIPPVKLTGTNQFLLLTGKGLPHIELKIYKKFQGGHFKTYGDLKMSVIGKLYNELMAVRMNRLKSKVVLNNIFSEFEQNASIYLTQLNILQGYLSVAHPHEIKEAFVNLIIELDRVGRFGFTPLELEAAKEKVSSAYTLSKYPNSHSIANDYIQHFLDGSMAPSPESKNKVVMQLVKNISLKEVNQLAANWLSDKDRDIFIVSPEEDKSLIPDEATLMDWVRQTRQSDIDPYVDVASVKELITDSELPSVANVAYETSKIDEIDVSEVVLHNGIKLIFKPVRSDQPGQIQLHGFSSGGASLYDGDEYYMAKKASSIIMNSGISGIDKAGILEILDNNGIYINPYIEDNFEGIMGTAQSSQIETVMQAVYQYFKKPNKNKQAFEDWRKSEINSFKSKTFSIRDTIQQLTNGTGLRNAPEAIKMLRRIDFERCFEIYNERFSNITDFTFVLTGDFNVDDVLPVIARYLGSLPVTGVKENYKNLNRMYPEGKARTRTIKGPDHSGTDVDLFFSGNYLYNDKSNIGLNILNRILKLKLYERLRQKEGVYAVSTSVAFFRNGDGRYFFSIQFNCDSTNVERLTRATLEEIEKLSDSEIDPLLLHKAIANEKQVLAASLKRLSFWSDYLVERYQNMEDPKGLLKWHSLIDEITLSDIKALSSKFLNEENYVRFISL